MAEKGDDVDVGLTNLAIDLKDARALCHLCWMATQGDVSEAAATALSRGLNMLDTQLDAIRDAIETTQKEYLNA